MAFKNRWPDGGAQRPFLIVPKLKLWMLAAHRLLARPKPNSSKYKGRCTFLFPNPSCKYKGRCTFLFPNPSCDKKTWVVEKNMLCLIHFAGQSSTMLDLFLAIQSAKTFYIQDHLATVFLRETKQSGGTRKRKLNLKGSPTIQNLPLCICPLRSSVITFKNYSNMDPLTLVKGLL